jgi:hypothetical protein
LASRLAPKWPWNFIKPILTSNQVFFKATFPTKHQRDHGESELNEKAQGACSIGVFAATVKRNSLLPSGFKQGEGKRSAAKEDDREIALPLRPSHMNA